jgi:hypothetical protein
MADLILDYIVDPTRAPATLTIPTQTNEARVMRRYHSSERLTPPKREGAFAIFTKPGSRKCIKLTIPETRQAR